MYFDEKLLFESHESSNYRIPSIISTKDGSILAFCNDRKNSLSDHAQEVELVFRRMDPSSSWGERTCLARHPGWSCMIASAVYDAITDTAFCTFARDAVRLDEFGDYSDEERKKLASEAELKAKEEGLEIGLFDMVTHDSGKTWTEERQYTSPITYIDPNTGERKHTVPVRHGSEHGIQLRYGKHKGRLLCPARFMTGHYQSFAELRKYCYNCSVYSDDHGKTWHSGGIVQLGTGEGALLERSDGTIYFNSRAYYNDQRRLISYSTDDGSTFYDAGRDPFLLEENRIGCSASLLRVDANDNQIFSRLPDNAGSLTLFGNPRAENRTNMTICCSFDEGRTWAHTKCIWEGPSAYSSLAVSPITGHFFLLYEKGYSINAYEAGIAVAEFDLDWLLS